MRFVYTSFKSSDQSNDKISFEIFNIFRVKKACAMNAKGSIIPRRMESLSYDVGYASHPP